MSYIGSSQYSTGNDESIPFTAEDSRLNSIPSSLDRDSVMTYTTDLDDSSGISTSVPTEMKHDIIERPYFTQQQTPRQQNNIRPFYQRKRFWALCGAISVILSAIFIPLLFLVIIPNVAQSTVNKSQINFDSINITNPTNDSFVVKMSGKTSGTGPFDAKITFNGPVDILYNGATLGSVEMGNIEVSKGQGSLTGTEKTFQIENKELFNEFTSKIMTEKEFVWVLQGSASVRALGISINNVRLNKTLTIAGSNGFVTNLIDLKVTENPDKSLTLNALTNVYNPSPIGIELGDIVFQLKCDQTLLATVTASDVFLTKENNLTMIGTSVVPTTDQDKANFIKVINGYLTGTPVNTTTNILSVTPKGGPVYWLSNAVKGLTLNAVVGGQPSNQKIINSVDFGEIHLKFTPDDPNPTISSKNSVAQYSLPFNINIRILSAGQKLIMSTPDNRDFVTIEIPEVPVNSTATQLSLDIPETKMQVTDSKTFSELFANLTRDKDAQVIIKGTANITSITDILGQVSVQGVPFNLTTSLQGFNQFNVDGNPPNIIDLTILAGTSDQLFMGVIANLTNPSQYFVSIGEVSFDLVYKEHKLGTAIIEDLSLSPGPNPVAILTILNDPTNGIGKEVFTAYLTGQEATMSIRGTENSTRITNLVPAFNAINISSVLPPLKTQFISSAKVVPTAQTASTGYAMGVSEMVNPFVTPVSIYTLNSTFSFNGTLIGSIDQDIRNNPIFIPGNTVQTIQLPFKMVIDPSTSFMMLRTLALQNNLDVTVLDSIIALSNVSVPGANPNAKPTPDEINSFNLSTFITTAMAKIPITANVTSQIAIGDYFTTMTYKQDIATTTDQSILSLVPAFALPLVSRFMGQAQMSFDSMFIQNIDVASFDTFVSGQVSNTGPLPAVVNFPNGLQVSSSNVHLGTVILPPISTDPAAGVTKFSNVSRFNIADIPTFTSFVLYSYTSDSIEWEISTDNAVITTFGLPIGPIPIKKSLQVPGFNGLKQYNVTGFNPAPLSITITLNNPTGFGIELGKVVYGLNIEDVQVATITGNNITIVPHSENALVFQGELNQTDTHLITNFVNPNPPPIIAQGISITPPKATGEVLWLSEPFKSIPIVVPFEPAKLLGQGGAPSAPSAPAAPNQK